MSRLTWVALAIIVLVGRLWPLPENDKSFMGMVVLPMMIVGPLIIVAAHYYLRWKKRRARE